MESSSTSSSSSAAEPAVRASNPLLQAMGDISDAIFPKSQSYDDSHHEKMMRMSQPEVEMHLFYDPVQ